MIRKKIALSLATLLLAGPLFAQDAAVRVPAKAAVGSPSGDAALAQLLEGFAVLEGELARKGFSGSEYRVQPGDTLDEIIFKTLGDLAVRHEIIRSAFVRANPRAFRRRNPNYILAEVVLRVPGPEDFRAVVFDTPAVGKTVDRRRMIRYP